MGGHPGGIINIRDNEFREVNERHTGNLSAKNFWAIFRVTDSASDAHNGS